MNRFIFIYCFYFLCTCAATAQDIHFSQHFHSNTYINSSYNGLPSGFNRVSLNTKNQWISAKAPFNTYLLAFDNSWKINKVAPAFFSSSALLYYDVAGDGDFITIQFSPSLAYTFQAGNASNNLISLGIQPGFVQRSIDFNKLNFGDQFDGYTFDPDRQTTETIHNQSFNYADIGIGGNFSHFIDNNSYLGMGLSLHHLNNPIVSFNNNEDVSLKTKMIIHGEAKLYYNDYFVLPSFYYAKQGPHTETLIGARVLILKSDAKISSQNIMLRKNILFGLYYRNKDALITYFGFEFQNYNFGISYDFNLSRLLPSSSARGGIEFSAAYVWSKNKSRSNKEIPCPIF